MEPLDGGTGILGHSEGTEAFADWALPSLTLLRPPVPL